MLMRDIAHYYKGLLPNLKRMKIKSDGCRAQYKGKENFREMGLFHLKRVSKIAQRAAAHADTQQLQAVYRQRRSIFDVDKANKVVLNQSVVLPPRSSYRQGW